MGVGGIRWKKNKLEREKMGGKKKKQTTSHSLGG